MNECEWKKRLSTTVEEANDTIKCIEKVAKDADAMAKSSENRNKISCISNKLTRCEKKVGMESDPVRKNTLVTMSEKLRMDEEEALKEMGDGGPCQ